MRKAIILTWVLAPQIYMGAIIAHNLTGIHILKVWASYYSCVLHFISLEDNQVYAELNRDQHLRKGPSIFQTNSSLLTRKMVQYHQTKRSKCTYTCVIFLLLRIQTTVSKQDLISVLEHLQSSVFLHVNPKFITFALPTTGQRDVTIDTFLTTLPLIHISSMFLVVSADSRDINLVCQYCTKVGGIIKKMKNVRGIEALIHQWFTLHKNLSETPVTIKRIDLRGFAGSERSHCDSLGIHFLGDKRICSLKWMEKFLNFKTKFELTKSVPSFNAAAAFNNHEILNHTTNIVTDLSQIEVDNFQVIMVHRHASKFPRVRLEWIPHVWLVNPISFTLVLDKTMLSRSALFKPFDPQTWTLATIFWVLVSLVLILCLWIHERRARRNEVNNPYQTNTTFTPDVIKIMMVTLGSVMEQNPSDLTIKKAIRSFQVLFGTWLLISLVLSNAYTGIVISFLCSEIIPHNVPNTFQELVTSFAYYPIITADTVYISEHGTTFPVLPSLISEFLNYVNQSEFPDVYDDYKKLRSSIISLTKVTKSKFAYAFDKQIAIPGQKNSLNTTYKIPAEFVYASLDSLVNRFTRVIKRNPQVTVWHPPEDELIRAIMAFSVTRNYFSMLFRKYSYLITEAGFLTIWDRKEQDRYAKMDLERYNNLTMCDNSKIWADSIKCVPSATESSLGYSNSEIANNENSKPLPLKILGTLFTMYFVGHLVSFAIVIVEVFSTVRRHEINSGTIRSFFSSFQKSFTTDLSETSSAFYIADVSTSMRMNAYPQVDKKAFNMPGTISS